MGQVDYHVPSVLSELEPNFLKDIQWKVAGSVTYKGALRFCRGQDGRPIQRMGEKNHLHSEDQDSLVASHQSAWGAFRSWPRKGLRVMNPE